MLSSSLVQQGLHKLAATTSHNNLHQLFVCQPSGVSQSTASFLAPELDLLRQFVLLLLQLHPSCLQLHDASIHRVVSFAFAPTFGDLGSRCSFGTARGFGIAAGGRGGGGSGAAVASSAVALDFGCTVIAGGLGGGGIVDADGHRRTITFGAGLGGFAPGAGISAAGIHDEELELDAAPGQGPAMLARAGSGRVLGARRFARALVRLEMGNNLIATV